MFFQVVLYAVGLLLLIFILGSLMGGGLPRLFAKKNALHGRLVGACFGDKVKAVRLADYEQKRAPNINRTEAVRRALNRLEDDRR